jgi:hypothetical protein
MSPDRRRWANVGSAQLCQSLIIPGIIEVLKATLLLLGVI